ncbi:hypothetical protein CWO91_33590 [Bradyrhizobium genosp. SA-3]|nr:hypothetical protein CWO91_33590 [Bradyrhizobium genosp. SA-3]
MIGHGRAVQFIANPSLLQQISWKESIALAATKRDQCAPDQSEPPRIDLANWKSDGGAYTPSLRAKRSNPGSFRGDSLDCFVARAPRNDGVEAVVSPGLSRAREEPGLRFAPSLCELRRTSRSIRARTTRQSARASQHRAAPCH